jgi:hypothetical protein
MGETLDAMLDEYLECCWVRVLYRHHETASWKLGVMTDARPFRAEDGEMWQAIAPDHRHESAPTTDTAPVRASCLRIVEIVPPGHKPKALTVADALERTDRS